MDTETKTHIFDLKNGAYLSAPCIGAKCFYCKKHIGKGFFNPNFTSYPDNKISKIPKSKYNIT